MYNFYQYEKANKNKTLTNELVMTSLTSSAASPKQATTSINKGRSKSYMGNAKGDLKHNSVELRRKSDVPPTHTRSPHEKRERLVESYKSRVAGFIKDVSAVELLENVSYLITIDDCETNSRI